MLDLYVTVMIEEQQRQRQAPIDDVMIAVFFYQPHSISGVRLVKEHSCRNAIDCSDPVAPRALL